MAAFSVYRIVLRILISGFCVSICNLTNVDDNGYIVYCPCMGRFGNQADHFLGSLGFAKALNRTLIIPPWVEYRQGATKSIQVPFDTYFKVEPLLEYHRVLTMDDFMSNLAPMLWPPGNRTVFCYRSREGVNDCLAKEGNPFGPFWDTYLVDFDRSEFYSPLHYDVVHHKMSDGWKEKYPPADFPVLAFMGAPASFPVQAQNRVLHRFLQWNDIVETRAKEFIQMSLPKGRFVGIHLRNGVDWTNACEHVDQSPNLFAAPQCLGYNNEHGRADHELCFPSRQTVLKQLKRIVKEIKAKAVFVASDSDHMLADIDKSLRKLKVTAFRYEPPDPHVELAILGLSNHFIGNCISTFSAFVKRERDVAGFPSSFWSLPRMDDDKAAGGSREEL